MASVHCISKSTVQATSSPSQAEAQRVELTPWDLQFLLLNPIQKGLLFYKPHSQQGDGNLIINRLKASLSRTLDFFPPLAGRLATVEHDDDTASFYIDCNNAGALFVHAMADGVSVSDIIDSIYVPNIVHSFFQLNGITNIDGTSEPILAIQVTELVDGIFVGWTANHSVCDGSSVSQFIRSWSEISCGSVRISKSPIFQRWLPDGISFPIHIPDSEIKQIQNQYVPMPFLLRVFHFTKESIKKLKTKANAEVGTEKISSLQALFSHVWRSVSRVKHLDPDMETRYSFAIGCRSRLQHLPEEYFGNATQSASLTLNAKQLAEEHGLGKTAWKMNRTIGDHTEEKLSEFPESWSRRPKLVALGSVARNELFISGSPRFNVYVYDFGWGKPVAVRYGAGNRADGKITFFCGVEEGSIDIEVCLLPETVEALGKDEDFMATQTI